MIIKEEQIQIQQFNNGIVAALTGGSYEAQKGNTSWMAGWRWIKFGISYKERRNSLLLEIGLTAPAVATLSDTMEPEMDKPAFCSRLEATKYLGVSRATLWRWEQEGAITAVKIGNSSRLRWADVISLGENGGSK